MIQHLPNILASSAEQTGTLDGLVENLTIASIVVIAISMIVCIHMLIYRRHLAERALAVDTFGTLLVGLVVLYSILPPAKPMFMDGILVLLLLSFAGSVAIAQYIGRPHAKRKKQNTKTKTKTKKTDTVH